MAAIQSRLVAFSAGLAALIATSSGAALAQKKIRHRRHRYRNQDRQYHALQWTCVLIRRDQHEEARLRRP